MRSRNKNRVKNKRGRKDTDPAEFNAVFTVNLKIYCMPCRSKVARSYGSCAGLSIFQLAGFLISLDSRLELVRVLVVLVIRFLQWSIMVIRGSLLQCGIHSLLLAG